MAGLSFRRVASGHPSHATVVSCVTFLCGRWRRQLRTRLNDAVLLHELYRTVLTSGNRYRYEVVSNYNHFDHSALTGQRGYNLARTTREHVIRYESSSSRETSLLPTMYTLFFIPRNHVFCQRRLNMASYTRNVISSETRRASFFLRRATMILTSGQLGDKEFRG